MGIDALFPGSGELVELCRRADWSSTALGPVELWPSALQHAVANLLAQPFGSFVLWGPERILIYNDAFRPVIGDGHPGALARSLDAISPEAAALLAPVVDRVMAGESVCIQDARWDIEHDGNAAAAWFTLSSLPLRDDSGRVAGVLTTAIETTARKQAEDALRRSDERRAFLLDLSDALSVLIDPVAIQSAACRLLCDKIQCDRAYYCYFDEVAGIVEVPREYLRSAVPSMIGRYPLAAFDWVSAAFRLGRRLSFNDTQNSPLIPADRRAAMADIQVGAFIVAPLLREGRLLVCLVVSDVAPRVWTSEEAELVQEVAERTWAAVERALAEAALAAELSATKILQQLSVELIPNQGPAIYDKLLDAAMQLMGAHAASLQGLPPGGARLELLASRNLHPLSAEYWSFVEAGSSSACGHALARADRVLAADVERTAFLTGTRDLDELRRSGLRAVLSTPLVARSGQTVGMISVHWRHVHQPSERDFSVFDVLARQVADLLERGRAEAKAVEARAQAESANRAKDEFLATLSHELRTPVAAILLWAGALRSGAVPLQDLTRAIDAIVKSAESQSRLIEDLLDLSRLASGKLTLAHAVVDVRACAQAALDMVKPIAAAKDIRLESDIAGDCSALLDGTRLQQILWNLLTNATKFTSAGGTVRLRVDAGARGLELVVSDTGEGIAPEFLPHLFEKFSQYDMGETRQHMGLGIGLALTRQLVELHGGTIEAESAGIGRGALFRVRLPWREPGDGRRVGAVVPHAAGFAPSPLTSLRVLLVEDDSLTREAMRWTLSRAGALVVDVATADDALLAVGDGDAVDVIVSDLGLPTTSGLELIEHIGNGARRRGRPVPPSCAVSAHAREVDRRRAIDAGFDMYITKPVSPECLIEAVSDLREILVSGRE
jgi:signal transduction histidine kinase/CheY-like chemotaxis protein